MHSTIRDSLNLAFEAHQSGRLEEAKLLYEELLKIEPNHLDVNYKLGLLKVSLNQINDALPLFKNALKGNPGNRDFWITYIDTLIKEELFDNAKSILEQGKKRGLAGVEVEALEKTLEIKSLESSLKIINTEFFKKKNFKKKYLRQIIKFPPADEISVLIEYYNSGKYVLAAEMASKITKIFPSHQLSWKILGIVLRKIGKLDQSLLANEISIKLSPKDAEAYCNLGNVLSQLQRFDEAVSKYGLAISIDPSIAETYNNLGVALRGMKRFHDSEKSFLKATELRPEYLDAYNNLGNTLKDLGKLNESEISYQRAIKINPDFAEAHNNLAVLYQDSGRLEDAIKSYKNAITIRPNYLEALFNFSNILLYSGDNLGAVERLSQLSKTGHEIYSLKSLVLLAVLEYLANNHSVSKQLLLSSTEILKYQNSDCRNELSYWNYLNALLEWHSFDKPEIHLEKVIYVIGESHSLGSHGLSIDTLRGKFLCKSQWILGCKQWHLGNMQPNKYKYKFNSIIQSLPKESEILIAIGEIDCRIDEGILNVYEKISDKSILEIIESTINDYLKFVKEKILPSFHRVTIQGIPCPNINIDNIPAEKVGELIYLIKEFNTTLRKTSKEMGFNFLDLHSLTDRGDGFSNKIWHLDNHHLSPNGILEAWRSHLLT